MARLMLSFMRWLLLSAATCLLLHADELKTGVFRGQPVVYRIVDGMAITEGDIILGTTAELEQTPEAVPTKEFQRQAIAIAPSVYRWPEHVIPYVISDDVGSQQRVLDAIQHWNENTPIRLVERTTERNYVRFRRVSSGCSSFVGMIGIGEQSINIADGCTTGSVIHEIGHAAGLFHEQSRQDRNAFVKLLRDNIDKRELTQYRQELNSGLDVGSYDFGSIMQYSINGFSRNGFPTLATLPAGIPLGQRNGLSPADIDAVKRIYGESIQEVTIGIFPATLEFTVDGETYRGSKSFSWPWGSVHRVSVAPLQASGSLRYRFARWSDGGDVSHTITADQNQTVLTANFAGEYKIPISAVTEGGTVRVEPASADGYYPLGTTLTLTVVPDAGAKFLRWSGTIYTTIHGRSQNPIRIPVDSGLAYEARFTRANVTTIASNPAGRRVVVDGETTTTPHTFAWTPGSTHTIAVSAARQLNGAQTSRHDFQSWDDGGDAEHTVAANTDSERTIIANFQTQHLLTTSASPNTGGRLQLSPPSPDGFYDEGTLVQITPVPTGNFRFSSWGEDGAESVTMSDQMLVTAQFGIPGQISASGIVNAASFLPGPIAPGEIVTMFGLEVGPAQLTTGRLNGSGRLDAQLAGTRVLFDGVPAPLIYVAHNQLSAVVPYSLAGRTSARVQVEFEGRMGNVVSMPIAAAAPAFFTASSSGIGPGAFLNQDGSVNGPSNPARRGSAVVLYATGEGQTSPSGEDGRIAIAPLPKPINTVRAFLAGQEVRVDYAGAAPGLVAGALQVNIRLPDDAPTGDLPIVLQVGEVRSPNTVTLSVR